MKQRSLFVLSFIFMVGALKAQFSIQSEFRNRFELRHGYREMVPKGSTPAGLIWQRTRLSFTFENENFKLKLTPQDVRLWGEETQRSSTGVFGDDASLELFEAYSEVKLGNIGWLSVGRQVLKYDNQRLLAERNWNNGGLSYDALLLKLNAGNLKLHVGTTWNSLEESAAGNFYPSGYIKNLNFLWANNRLGDHLTMSLLHIAAGVTETDTTNTLHFKQTTGLYGECNNDFLNAKLEFYYQYGKSKEDKKVSAFLVAFDAGLKNGSLIPGVGLTWLSGNSKNGAAQTTENLFDIHYGARHRFYGFMDYFRNFSSHTSQGGLVDFYYYLNYKFSKSISACNTGHYFKLAQTNSLSPRDKKLGYENDLVVKYKFNDWGVFEGGYLFFLPEKPLKTIQRIDKAGFQYYAYVQLTLTPTLFKK